MDYLISAIVTFYSPQMKTVSVYRCWLHFFVAIFTKDYIIKYICHVYTGRIYFINVIIVKSYKCKTFGKDMKRVKEYLKRIWEFLKQDSWASFAVTLFIAFVFIKFIFFPGISLITGTSLPIVIVESCSMYHHEAGFEKTFGSSVYEERGINIEDTKGWDFPNGFSKGDLIFVVGAKDVEVGDVIIFHGGATNPLIHRVVSIEDGVYSTKGDNYKTNPQQLDSELEIQEEQIIGKALFKIPAVGWVKLIFFESGRPSSERGFC